MHFLWIFFLKKRQFSILLIVVLIALGVYSVFVIPKESSPEVIIPMGIVTTIYPGASSSEIEKLITNKIEDAVENVDDLNWRDDPPPSARKAVSELIDPLILEKEDKDAFYLRGCMMFKDSLFKSLIKVESDGMVSLHEEELLVEDMPVLDDVFGQ